MDELESAGFFSSSATQRGFVLSPKAGVLFRVSDRAALDLAFYPIFIFDREKVSKQHQRLVDFYQATFPGAESGYSVIRYAMSRVGIGSSYISPPLPPASDEDKKRVDKALQAFSDVVDTY